MAVRGIGNNGWADQLPVVARSAFWGLPHVCSCSSPAAAPLSRYLSCARVIIVMWVRLVSSSRSKPAEELETHVTMRTASLMMTVCPMQRG